MSQFHLYILQFKIHALNQQFTQSVQKYFQEVMCETSSESVKIIQQSL